MLGSSDRCLDVFLSRAELQRADIVMLHFMLTVCASSLASQFAA